MMKGLQSRFLRDQALQEIKEGMPDSMRAEWTEESLLGATDHQLRHLRAKIRRLLLDENSSDT